MWADDAKAEAKIKAYLSPDGEGHGAHGTLFSSPSMTAGLGVTSGEANWKQRQAFNIISTYKLMAVRQILDTGTNVWFSDSDLVFVRDPWPRLRHQQACDYSFQNGLYTEEFSESEANTGFHLFRSNARTIAALHDGMNLAEKHSDRSDQWAFWEGVLRKDHVTVPAVPREQPVLARECAELEGLLRLCPLPRLEFVVGQKYKETDTSLATILHANWVVGRKPKFDMLTSWGVWALGEDYTTTTFGHCIPEKSLGKFHPGN